MHQKETVDSVSISTEGEGFLALFRIVDTSRCLRGRCESV